jgi:hypothetical protein
MISQKAQIAQVLIATSWSLTFVFGVGSVFDGGLWLVARGFGLEHGIRVCWLDCDTYLERFDTGFRRFDMSQTFA